MSRSSLQKVLKKVIRRLDQFAESNDTLRRGFSGIQTHTLDFSPKTVKQAVNESVSKMGLKPTAKQKNLISQEINNFSNSLKASWGTPEYEYTVEGDGRSNVFRKITETVVYKNAKNEFNSRVARILNSAEDAKFIDAGHSLGFGVSESALAFALGKDLSSTVKLILQEQKKTELTALIEKIPEGFLKGDKTVFNIKLQIESKAANRSTASKKNSLGIEERLFLGLVREEVRYLIDKEDWGEMQGSPSVADEILEIISSAASGKTRKTRKTISRAKDSKTFSSKSSTYVDKSTLNLSAEKKDAVNWNSIIAIINAKLPSVVASNMGSPALNNRTGQFVSSVGVSSFNITEQGFPSFGLTYDKEPYGVFDRRLGALPWATPGRDPYTLIQKSFRQIAEELAIGRFYLRRE